MITLGSSGSYAETPQSPEGREQVEKRFVQLRANMMQATLGLDDETRKKIEAILLESQQRQREFYRELQKKIAELQVEEQQKVRAVLPPQQQARFDEIAAMQRKAMEDIQQTLKQSPPPLPSMPTTPTEPSLTPRKKEKGKS